MNRRTSGRPIPQREPARAGDGHFPGGLGPPPVGEREYCACAIGSKEFFAARPDGRRLTRAVQLVHEAGHDVDRGRDDERAEEVREHSGRCGIFEAAPPLASVGALVITPTFDSSILDDPNAAAIESMVDNALTERPVLGRSPSLRPRERWSRHRGEHQSLGIVVPPFQPLGSVTSLGVTRPISSKNWWTGGAFPCEHAR